MLITMLTQRKAMNATCISTSGSEVRWEEDFTGIIVIPLGGGRECQVLLNVV